MSRMGICHNGYFNVILAAEGNGEVLGITVDSVKNLERGGSHRRALWLMVKNIIGARIKQIVAAFFAFEGKAVGFAEIGEEVWFELIFGGATHPLSIWCLGFEMKC